MMTLSKITRKSLFSLCALSLAGLSLSSCRHKDIDFDDVPMQEVKVVFDCSKAPEAAPASMALWLLGGLWRFQNSSHCCAKVFIH